MSISNQAVDHLGNEFKSFVEMCKYWNQNTITVKRRLNKGWSLEQALTKKIIVVDHLGNEFKSFVEMCKYWNKKECTVIARLNKGMSLEQALTENKTIIDHLGNEFKSFRSMCKYWNCNTKTVRLRLNKGWSLEQALTKKLEPELTVDHLGNEFKSFAEMCKYWNRKYCSVMSRLARNLDIAQCLDCLPIINCQWGTSVTCKPLQFTPNILVVSRIKQELRNDVYICEVTQQDGSIKKKIMSMDMILDEAYKEYGWVRKKTV